MTTGSTATGNEEKQQQQQQQHHLGQWPFQTTVNASSLPDDAVLTIAIDQGGSCPEKCTFPHMHLPSWVRYQFMTFDEGKNTLPKRLARKKQEGQFIKHLLIVARRHIPELAVLAKNHPYSVGLWQMADEQYDAKATAPIYHHFDYVIRHYYKDPYWDQGPNRIELRALGNLTCASESQVFGPPLPSPNNSLYPKWGMYWVWTDSHAPYHMTQRSRESLWPLAQRRFECSFTGSDYPHWNKGERKQMKAALEQVLGKRCPVTITKDFGKGMGPFPYYTTLADTKICPSPRGFAIETHRTMESLRQGCVPAIKDEPYLHRTFRAPPVIVASNWTQLAHSILYYLDHGPELQQLSHQATEFVHEYNQCVKGDMDLSLIHI